MAKRVLITGGCGFIGRNLAKRLLDSGCEVWAIDNLISGLPPEQWLSGSSKSGNIYQHGKSKLFFIQADIIEALKREVDKGTSSFPKFDEIYHLAAIVGGRAVTIEKNPMYVALDFAIDSVFFNWVVSNRRNIGKVLYMSSCISYPQELYMENARPLKEEDYSFSNGSPESIYGWIKRNGEFLAVTTSRKYGVSVACARPFSGYGPDQDQNYPVPSIAARAAKKEDPLIVWGSGEQARDFVYIDDLVSALQIIIEKISDGSGVNIGSGSATTFNALAKMLADIKGYNPAIKPLPDKPEGAKCLHADNTKLKSLGWKQTVPLKEGLTRMLAAQSTAATR